MKRKIDPTLMELCLGIFLYGIVFEAVLLLFSRNAAYSLGLWIGVVLAEAGSVHMWWSLNRGLAMGQKEAVKSISAHSITRYFILALVLAILSCTDFANPIFAFCGYMGMKLSAYCNPLIHRILAGKLPKTPEDVL